LGECLNKAPSSQRRSLARGLAPSRFDSLASQGLAASTALENVPPPARGLVSGFLQQGYAVGYLIAAVVNLTLVPRNPHTWRALYWVGTGLSVFAALFRACLPESKSFIEAQRARKNAPETGQSTSRVFLREAKSMLKVNWLRAIWAGKRVPRFGRPVPPF
jgi:SHS family lactate transporter-like MFS transporter